MSTRRTILKVGTATVLVVGAGAAGWALTRAPGKARAPWRAAGESFGDARLDALAYAILAPNPHNMQPWRVRLDGDDRLTVYCDPARLLPQTDPPGRQITIGFGCFLEMLRQAAAANGHAIEIDPFPDGEPYPTLDGRPVASVRFATDARAGRDPLFDGALSRRTNRAPYDLARPVPQADLDRIVRAGAPGVQAFASGEAAQVEALRTLAVDAWRTEWETAATRRESVDVTRIGKSEINAKPWGLSLAGPLIEGLAALGAITREKMDSPGSTAFDQSLKFYEDACRTSMAFVWSTTATNTRFDQLETGRAWVRMHLAAHGAGIAFHPLSQALQEYPEMAPHYERAHHLLAPEGGTVQMLCRLGYAEAPPPAPREPLEAKLINA